MHENTTVSQRLPVTLKLLGCRALEAFPPSSSQPGFEKVDGFSTPGFHGAMFLFRPTLSRHCDHRLGAGRLTQRLMCAFTVACAACGASSQLRAPISG